MKALVIIAAGMILWGCGKPAAGPHEAGEANTATGSIQTATRAGSQPATRPAQTYPLWGSDQESVAEYARRAGIKAVEMSIPLDGNARMKLALVPAGTFTMGEERTGEAHEVTITRPYYMAVAKVTREQYLAVVHRSPWREVVVRSVLEGNVAAVAGDVGKAIRQGDSLVELDSSPFADILKETRDALKITMWARGRANMEHQLALGRFRKGDANQDEVDRFARKLQQAEANLAVIRQPDQDASDAMLNCAQFSPNDSRILERPVKIGDHVVRGQVLIVTGDPNQRESSEDFPHLPATNMRSPHSPATNMSWYDAEEFCRVLSARTGRKVRLPTEAEWDLASHTSSRVGVTGMTGDISEWTGDWEGDYGKEAKTDPKGAATGWARILCEDRAHRGVSPDLLPIDNVRHHYRSFLQIGFRVVVEVE